MKIKLAFAFVFLLLVQSILAQQKPSVSEVDRTRLAEAFKIGQTLGNSVWKEWGEAPFAVLLST